VDVHCHILPGIDDGPRNLIESLNLCRALVVDGITDVIATPHQLGRWDGTNHPDEIRRGVTDLQAKLDAAQIPLRLHAGGELRLDERIPQLIGSGKVMTLADQGAYMLLELPMGFNVDPAALVRYLTASGTRIVLAHAERYDTLTGDERVAEAWVNQPGVAFQVNAQSLLDGGPHAEAAWQWISLGWVALIATDAHSIGTRRPRMSDAIEHIVERAGIDEARRICLENPSRVLDGGELLDHG
jgi:protein-tyrosine phosphatase